MPIPLLIPLGVAAVEAVSLSAGAIAAIFAGSAIGGGGIIGGLAYYFSSNDEHKEEYAEYQKLLQPTERLFSNNQKIQKVLKNIQEMHDVYTKELSVEDNQILINNSPALQQMRDQHLKSLKKEQFLRKHMALMPHEYSEWDKDVSKRYEAIKTVSTQLQNEVNTLTGQLHELNTSFYSLVTKAISLREQRDALYVSHQKLKEVHEQHRVLLTQSLACIEQQKEQLNGQQRLLEQLHQSTQGNAKHRNAQVQETSVRSEREQAKAQEARTDSSAPPSSPSVPRSLSFFAAHEALISTPSENQPSLNHQ